MVTWLQIPFFLVVGIGFDVTETVTNGYIGYKPFIAII